MPRDRHHAAVVQLVQRIDALNGAAFAVVEVPENNLVLVIKGLLLDGVIEDEAAIIQLELADNLFNPDPQVFRCVQICGQLPSYFVMVNFTIQHCR